MFDADAITVLPDVILGSRGFPADRRPRLISTGYGGSVRSSFSGSAGYLADAGIDNGTLDGAFTLYSTERPDRQLQVRGALWKARRLLARQQSGGFKFSAEFSSHLWRRHLAQLSGVDVISTFQLMSRRFFDRRSQDGIRSFFYLDGTLHDYLRGYREFDVAGIDPATTDRAIETERRGYERADGLFVMSEFTANTMVSVYGLPRERIDVVLPGANMTDEMAEQVLAIRAARTGQRDFTVGFVGVYPERKGLAKLAAAVDELRRSGLAVRLLVVGRCPDAVAAIDGVEALGVISKTDDPDRFAAALAAIDLGCQLSTVELFGIAMLEFLRCGIPFLATDVGGISDILQGGGGVGVPSDVTSRDVAAALRHLIEDRAAYDQLSSQAMQRRDDVRWQRTAARLGELVNARP